MEWRLRGDYFLSSIFAEERGGRGEVVVLLLASLLEVLGRIPGKCGARWAFLDLWNSENLSSPRVNCVKRNDDEFIEQSGDVLHARHI